MSDKLRFTAIYDSPEKAQKSAADLRHFLNEGATARRYFTGYFADMSGVIETFIPEHMRADFWESFKPSFPEVCIAIEVADEEFAHPDLEIGENWPTPRTDPWPCLSGFSDDAAESVVVEGNCLMFMTGAGVDRYPDQANSLNFGCFLGDVVTGRFGAHELEWSVLPADEGPSPGS